MTQDHDFSITGGMLHFNKDADLIIHPNALLGSYGQAIALKMPLRPGKWYTWLMRFCEADRAHGRRIQTGGRCILGHPGHPSIQILDVMRELGPVTVITENLLAYPTERRISGGTLRLIPGSFRSAFVISRLDTEDHALPIFISSTSPLQRIDLRPMEEIKINPYSLVAYQTLAQPRSFVSRLRVRDIILPRIPGALKLTFSGPARLWLQLPETAGKKPSRRQQTS